MTIEIFRLTGSNFTRHNVIPWRRFSVNDPLWGESTGLAGFPEQFVGQTAKFPMIWDDLSCDVTAMCRPYFSDPGFTTSDPRWIGAWWLGYLVCPTLLMIPCTCLIFYPKITRVVQKQISEEHSSADGVLDTAESLVKGMWCIERIIDELVDQIWVYLIHIVTITSWLVVVHNYAIMGVEFTAQFLYNTANFLRNTQNRHHTPRPIIFFVRWNLSLRFATVIAVLSWFIR